MDILLEFVAELYMELMMLLVPEKQFGKKLTRFLKILCGLTSVSILFLIMIGIGILSEPEATAEHQTGIICLAVGGALLLMHVIMFISVVVKRKK